MPYAVVTFFSRAHRLDLSSTTMAGSRLEIVMWTNRASHVERQAHKYNETLHTGKLMNHGTVKMVTNIIPKQSTLTGLNLYAASALRVKLSLFLLYLRLFQSSRITRWLIYGGIAACG